MRLRAVLRLLLAALIIVVALAKDHYRVLGLRRGAGDREIKKAYHKLALRYHPDKNDAPNAEARFAEIANAYEVLSDPEKKRRYDLYGDEDERQEQMRRNQQQQQQRQQQWQQQRWQSQRGGGGGGGGAHFNFGFGQRQQRQQPPIDSATESLTYDSWDSEVLSRDHVWLVQFYSDVSQPSRDFSAAWEAAAKQLNSYVRCGRVDVSEAPRLHRRYGMEGLPSLLLFADGAPITAVAERPTDRWGAGGPLSSKEVVKIVLDDYPDALERLPSADGPPTVTRVQSWANGADTPLDSRRGNMPALVLVRDRRVIKKTEHLALRVLARKFRKHLRLLLVDVSPTQCTEGGATAKEAQHCKAELAAIKQQWPESSVVLREPGQPPVPIRSSGGVTAMRKELKAHMLLTVPELTSRTIECVRPSPPPGSTPSKNSFPPLHENSCRRF